MDYLTPLLLGAIQGVTEFLPISSSGHLVLFQKFLGFNQPGITFDVIVHLGTLIAVFLYFRTYIFEITLEKLRLIIVMTIPTVIIGFLLKQFFEDSFEVGGAILALQFFISALICFYIDRVAEGTVKIDNKIAGFMGISQAISILPAISRSGSTIATALAFKVDKKEAARFSFVASIPAILGANLLEIIDNREMFVSGIPLSYLLGFLSSLVVGYLAIDWTLKLLQDTKMKYFGYYLLAIAGIALFV